MSKKISELTETIEPTTNDVLPIVSGGETKKVTLSNIISIIKNEGGLSGEETDPTVPAHVKNITEQDIANWNAGGSGGGGITNETDPTVPDHVKNITQEDIDRWNAGGSGGEITSETDPTVPTYVKNITETDITNWNNKSNFSGNYNDLTNKPTIPSEYELPIASSTSLGGIKVGANLTIASDGTLNATGGGEGGTTDYTALSNKPKINGVELTGDKTSADLGITGGGGNGNILTFENITVATTSFVEDTTYEEFGYKAEIPCTGVTADFFSDVTFDVAEAISGNYAPISLTGAGTVTIYAVEQPESTITIPSIICSKGA